MSKFELINVNGFMILRKLKVIRDKGHELVAALDPNACVGIKDNIAYYAISYFARRFFDLSGSFTYGNQPA